ncbi:MAG: hypothetical protein LBP80_03725 [Treponema sp.]|jgi:hypothetical protein|nr:hypothetical protein [Treponema sp.]
MAKLLFLLSAIIFISCGNFIKPVDTAVTREEKLAAVESIMASGAAASDIRPRAGLLSEQEVLLKAADYLYSIGGLDPSFYAYEEEPRLLTAKIETPVLFYFPDGTPASYYLMAVDEKGECLMGSMVHPETNVDLNSFETVRDGIIPNKPDYLSSHFITKREAAELIKTQFPGNVVSEPIAVRGLFLEGHPHSNSEIFWYFTVGGSERGAEAVSEEYIIDADIMGYSTIAGGVSNRSAISAGRGGSPLLDWERMAKLNTPLNLFEKIEASNARALAGDNTAVPYQRTELKYTPVPLR